MCTHFLLSVPANPPSPDPMYVTARCLELAGSLTASLYLVPEQVTFPLDPPPNPPVQQAMSWQNQYGFVALAHDASGDPVFMDGVNEKGLSAGALWLPGTGYPQTGNLYFTDFVAWILGTCATAADVQAMMQLEGVSVAGPALGDAAYLPLHFIATDASGQSVIIEFVGGAMVVYPPSDETADAVLTNAPTYDWQRANLAQYQNLSVVGPATSVSSNAIPVGIGLIGMPGDPTPVSRFVRAATLRKGFGALPPDGSGWLPAPGGVVANPPGTVGAVQTVVTAAMQMVIGIQSTPYGTSLEVNPLENLRAAGVSPAPPPPIVGDWTMWAVVRDHTNLCYYYTTGFTGVMRRIDLAQLSFAPAGPNPQFKTIQLLPTPPGLAWYEDSTPLFAAPGLPLPDRGGVQRRRADQEAISSG